MVMAKGGTAEVRVTFPVLLNPWCSYLRAYVSHTMFVASVARVSSFGNEILTTEPSGMSFVGLMARLYRVG